MLSIFSTKKSFDDRWIGSEFLNRRGLHPWRMRAAQTCLEVRRILSPGHSGALRDAMRQIELEGFAVVENFLPHDIFSEIAKESEQAFDKLEQERPVIDNLVPGFGARQNFSGGFDRYDGGTLNRFLDIDPTKYPAAARFVNDPRIGSLANEICGRPHVPHKTSLYLTVHGSDQHNADIQKAFHRDTYFSSMKFWYFLHPVTSTEGPFTYVPGSHLLTKERLAWEQEMASNAAQHRAGVENQGGSFRIDAQELPALGLEQPVEITCPGNTLVIADTLGFHRRGDAIPGSRRLAVYGWNRPYPFGLIGV